MTSRTMRTGAAACTPQPGTVSTLAAVVVLTATAVAWCSPGSPSAPTSTNCRCGRAEPAWFSEALEPLRGELGDDAVNDLALALRSVCGIETRVWLGEIAGLGPGGIRALQLWMTRALVARRLTSHRADGGPGEADLRSSHHRYLTDVSDTIGSWRGRAEPRAHPSCRSKLLGQTDNMTLRVGDERK